MPRNISDAFILECLDLGFCRLDWCLAFWYLENPRTCLTLIEYCELVMLSHLCYLCTRNGMWDISNKWVLYWAPVFGFGNIWNSRDSRLQFNTKRIIGLQISACAWADMDGAVDEGLGLQSSGPGVRKDEMSFLIMQTWTTGWVAAYVKVFVWQGGHSRLPLVPQPCVIC